MKKRLVGVALVLPSLWGVYSLWKHVRVQYT